VIGEIEDQLDQMKALIENHDPIEMGMSRT
jgi:hypothetical protein